MSTDRIIEILLAVPILIIAFMTYRFSTKTLGQQQKTGQVTIDAEAYERARASYESALNTTRAELADTRRDLADTRAQVAALRRDNERLHTELSAVKAELRELKRRTPPGGFPGVTGTR